MCRRVFNETIILISLRCAPRWLYIISYHIIGYMIISLVIYHFISYHMYKITRYNLRNKSPAMPAIHTDRFKNTFFNRIVFKYNVAL